MAVDVHARPRVLGDVLPGQLVRDAALVVGYAAFVGLTAQLVIYLPFTPVPITGQTFGVLLGGMALGARRGLAGMVVYALVGALGLPWFADRSGGLHVLLGATGGYIAGFIVAAALVGWLAERGLDRAPWTALPVMVAGNLVIYALGLAWLIHLGLPPADAFAKGMLPFLLGDAIKALVAAGLLPAAWLVVRRS